MSQREYGIHGEGGNLIYDGKKEIILYSNKYCDNSETSGGKFPDRLINGDRYEALEEGDGLYFITVYYTNSYDVVGSGYTSNDSRERNGEPHPIEHGKYQPRTTPGSVSGGYRKKKRKNKRSKSSRRKSYKKRNTKKKSSNKRRTKRR